MARDLPDPQGKLPKMVLAETQAGLDEEERQSKEREKWLAKNRLVEDDDYEWKKLNSAFDCIYYLLLGKYDSLYDAKKELGESLGLSENDIRIIYGFFSSVLMSSERGLEKAEKLLGER